MAEPCDELDATWMRSAVELAEGGRGWVEPNPLVGCVVVRDGREMGRGLHERFGQAHAEVNALRAAGGAARGGTLYVNLEPCCHHGKTPPCTDAIIRAGIVRVVVAVEDPFPSVAGKGVEQLRRAGIAVTTGVLEGAAQRLNAPYFKRVRRRRPWVIAKWAMSLDGKIATAAGDSRWISSPAARRAVHELRGRVDAIAIGAETARRDDPLLTARPPGPRRAARIVFDPRLTLPLSHQLVRTARETPLWIVAPAECDAARRRALESAGAEIIECAAEAGRSSVAAVLDLLHGRGATNVLVEGGGQLCGAFWDAGEVDEILAFVAPRVLGGTGPTPVAGRGADPLADAAELCDVQWQQVDGELWLRGRVRRPDSPR